MNKKLECKEILGIISSYLDRDIDSSLCDQVDTHMKDCKPCEDLLNTLVKTVDMCKNFKIDELPKDEKTSLRKELEAEVNAFVDLIKKSAE